MKALVCRAWGGPDLLRWEDLPEPALSAGHVRIQVHAAGIGFQDLLIVAGQYGLRPDFPFVPGCEIAGTVVACGEGVEDLAPGARVFGTLPFGGYAESVVLPRAAVAALPESVSFEGGAILGMAYGTAYQGLVHQARMRPGESLLVRGAGGGVHEGRTLPERTSAATSGMVGREPSATSPRIRAIAVPGPTPASVRAATNPASGARHGFEFTSST